MKYSVVLLCLVALVYGCSSEGGCSGSSPSISTPGYIASIRLSASPAVAKPNEPIFMRAYLVSNDQVVKDWFSNPNVSHKWTSQTLEGNSTVVLTSDPTEQPDGSVTARVDSTAPCKVRVTFTTGALDKSMEISWQD